MASASSLRGLRGEEEEEGHDDALEEGELRDTDDALEEGELRGTGGYGYGYDSSDEDDGGGYDQPFLLHPPRRGCLLLSQRDVRLLDPGAGGALPSPTPSSGSDGTVSDGGAADGSAVGSNGASPPADAVDRGWGAATGRRGWKAGGKDKGKGKLPAAASALVPVPVPTPYQMHGGFGLGLALAQSSSSTTLSAGGHASSSTSVTALHAAHHQPPRPRPLPELPQPLHAALPPPLEKEYSCTLCAKKYPSNQALGGHMAGHKNRQREALAAAAARLSGAAAPLRRGGARAGQPHECLKCGKPFPSGLALGGHMRVHYTGPKIVPNRKNKNRCLAPLVIKEKGEPSSSSTPPRKEEEASSSMLPPVPAGGVRAVLLFGIDISQPPVQAPLEQQQSSGATKEGSSSTGGQHQQQH